MAARASVPSVPASGYASVPGHILSSFTPASDHRLSHFCFIQTVTADHLTSCSCKRFIAKFVRGKIAVHKRVSCSVVPALVRQHATKHHHVPPTSPIHICTTIHLSHYHRTSAPMQLPTMLVGLFAATAMAVSVVSFMTTPPPHATILKMTLLQASVSGIDPDIQALAEPTAASPAASTQHDTSNADPDDLISNLKSDDYGFIHIADDGKLPKSPSPSTRSSY